MPSGRVLAVRGAGLTIIGSLGRLLIQVASVIVLSRLLDPSDFGLLAMVTVFIALADLLRDFGIPTAGLQAKHLSNQQASNLFWVACLLGGVTALMLVAASPLISSMYSEPKLQAIIPAMALAVIVNGVQAQIQVQLARALKFGTLAYSEVVAQLLGFTSAVLCALAGWGYWALVAQSLVTYTSLLVVRWVVLRWIPTWPRRGHGLRGFLKSGAEYGAAYFLTYAASNVDTLIVGIRWGPAQTGYYNRAYQMLSFPMGRLLTPLTNVVVPSINGMKNGGRSISSAIAKIQFAVGFGGIWIFATAAGMGSTVVPFFLGPGWTASIPIFQALAVGGCFWILSYASYWIFIIHEASRELLHYNLASKPMVIALVLGGSAYGVEGVAWGYALGMALSWPLNLVWLHRSLGADTLALGLNGLVILVGGLAAATAAWATDNAVSIDILGDLVVSSLVAIAAMLSVVAIPKAGRRGLSGLWGLLMTLLGRHGNLADGVFGDEM